MPTRALDLVAVSVAAIVTCILTVGGVAATLVRGPAGLAMVLLLPGYALAAAFFPGASLVVVGTRRPASGGLVERLLVSLGLSLAVAALGGLLLNLTPVGLTASSWAVLLGSVTLGASLVAVWRRRGCPPLSLNVAALRQAVSAGEAALLTAAVALVVVAFGVATIGAQRESFPGFTQLWMLPAGNNVVAIGVHNQEGRTSSYRLRVDVGGTIIAQWPSITLARGNAWGTRFTVPPAARPTETLQALLYRSGGSKAPYRYARLIVKPRPATVFVIVMENKNWSTIMASAGAHYIKSNLLPHGSYATQYYNPPRNHPSLPNYLWLEAGTNFGIRDDGPPSSHVIRSSANLVSLLDRAGIGWKAYEEGITGRTCPTTNHGLYATKHDPFVYFAQVSRRQAYCVRHIRPYSQFATDLRTNRIGRYNLITPNLCHDMHNVCPPTNDSIKQGDQWLATQVPLILRSGAYRNGGVLFITWDEGTTTHGEASDGPLGMIVLSPFAKGHAYHNNLYYTHSSTLRTVEEILQVRPFLGGAAHLRDLGGLFSRVP